MSKYEAVYFVGDNRVRRFFQNKESRRIFGLACSPNKHPGGNAFLKGLGALLFEINKTLKCCSDSLQQNCLVIMTLYNLNLNCLHIQSKEN